MSRASAREKTTPKHPQQHDNGLQIHRTTAGEILRVRHNTRGRADTTRLLRAAKRANTPAAIPPAVHRDSAEQERRDPRQRLRQPRPRHHQRAGEPRATPRQGTHRHHAAPPKTAIQGSRLRGSSPRVRAGSADAIHRRQRGAGKHSPHHQQTQHHEAGEHRGKDRLHSQSGTANHRARGELTKPRHRGTQGKTIIFYAYIS